MGSIEPIKCFFYFDKEKGCNEGKLVFVNADGAIFVLKCKIGKKEKTRTPIFPSLSLPKGSLPKGRLIIIGEKESSWLKNHMQFLPKTLEVSVCTDERDLEKKAGIVCSEAFYKHMHTTMAHRTKEGKALKGSLTRETRVFHVITGIFVTPAEMLSGVVRLAFSCAAVALGVLAFLAVKAAKAICSTRVKRLQFAEKTASSFVSTAVFNVRLALLQLVPIIGAQLANQYRQTGGLKGFIDAPAIGGLLGKIGLGAAQVVYGASSRRHVKMESQRVRDFWGGRTSPYQDEQYLSKKHPSAADAKSLVTKVCHSQDAITVRIPVEVKEGCQRYHDGTLLLSGKKDERQVNAPTVIMYHGRRGHRDSLLKVTQEHLDKGYNVLLASYAGDCVIQGNGRTYKEVPTPCTETAMVEDAQADIVFLSNLGVRNVKIYGFSLGGAQAMNCASVVARELPEVSRHLVVEEILLNKTFSHAEAVVERAARNKTKSPFLGRLARSFAHKFFIDEMSEKESGRHHFLDNKSKLKEVLKSPKFQPTRFYFEGAVWDPLMAERAHPEVNFAAELYQVVIERISEKEKRASLLITEKAHVL